MQNALKKIDACRILVVRPKGNTTVALKDNITMDIIELEWDGMDWIYPPQDRDE
jgi:hypothetical protein